MKKARRVVSMILCAVLVCICFAGCSQSTVTEVPDGDKTVIKWYAMGTKQPDHDEVLAVFNEELEKKYGMTLDLQLFNSADYGNKMNLIMASQEVFDICFVSSWVNKFSVVAPKGAILPLDDLLDKNAPELRNTLPDYMFKSASYNGKIYAIPNYQIAYSASGVMVQKKLAEKYGLNMDEINTFTDLEPFLQKIKDNEPGIFPIQAPTILNNEVENISGAYSAVRKGDTSLRVFDGYSNEYALSDLEIAARWFQKGYIRQDIDSVTSDVADVNANKYAVVLGTILPGVEGTMKTKTGQDYLCKALIPPYVAGQAGQSTMNAISSTSTHPDEAMKFLGIINTDKELFNLLMFGLEGKHYEKLSDNQIKISEDGKYKLGVSAWAFGNQFNAFYTESQEVGSWEKTDKINREAQQSLLLGFTPNVDNIKSELTAIENVVSEYNKIYVRSNWKELYKERGEKLKKAGIDTVVAEIQRQVDEWKKNK